MYSVVYITASGPGEAEKIASALVGEELVACVNAVPITSYFLWEGSMHNDAEVQMLCKTLTWRVDEVVARVKELHSYDVPCITHWPIAGGSESYLQWVGEQAGRQS